MKIYTEYDIDLAIEKLVVQNNNYYAYFNIQHWMEPKHIAKATESLVNKVLMHSLCE